MCVYTHAHTYGTTGTSLAVQWLRFCASTAGGMGLTPGQVRACITCAVRACSAVSNTFVTPWTVAHQAPLSMGFFRYEYWSGLPFPPPEDLPNPGVETAVQTDSLPLRHLRSPHVSSTPCQKKDTTIFPPQGVYSYIITVTINHRLLGETFCTHEMWHLRVCL